MATRLRGRRTAVQTAGCHGDNDGRIHVHNIIDECCVGIGGTTAAALGNGRFAVVWSTENIPRKPRFTIGAHGAWTPPRQIPGTSSASDVLVQGDRAGNATFVAGLLEPLHAFSLFDSDRPEVRSW